MTAQTRNRLARFDARMFRGGSVRFESCATFRPTEDPLVCRCGWLEDDHTSGREALVRPFPRPAFEIPARRAS
jgi:hypothetical protein